MEMSYFHGSLNSRRHLGFTGGKCTKNEMGYTISYGHDATIIRQNIFNIAPENRP